MEALQPPSAAGPAPGDQMVPERRAGAQARFEPNRRLIPARAAGTLCESEGGVKPYGPRHNTLSKKRGWLLWQHVSTRSTVARRREEGGETSSAFGWKQRGVSSEQQRTAQSNPAPF